MMRVMGLDIGDSRIGVALSDPLGVLASPKTIINRTDEKADMEAVVGLIRENQVGRVIAGLPLSMDGSQGRQVEKTRAFVTELCRHTNVPVEFRDERLSTVSAKRLVQGLKKNYKTRYDAMAAALILQGYLDEALQAVELRDTVDSQPNNIG